MNWIASYLEAWNAHDMARVIEFFTEDGVYVGKGLGERAEGRAAVREFFESLENTFSSDYRFGMGQALATDEAYAFEWTMTGTNDRAYESRGLPATGRRFEITGVSIGKLRDGKIVDEIDYWNLADYLMQVGLMPVPEQAAPVGR